MHQPHRSAGAQTRHAARPRNVTRHGTVVLRVGGFAPAAGEVRCRLVSRAGMVVAPRHKEAVDVRGATE